MADLAPGRCAVIGAGLAGAAVASSLARRGWQVEVIDAAQSPAAGASSLPAGLLAPHQSMDDNLLTRLTRAGVQATLQQAQALLKEGADWQSTGVLQHRVGDGRAPPQDTVWARSAGTQEKIDAGLAPSSTAWWHEKAAWVRPAALVHAWLAQPGIAWRGGTQVNRLLAEERGWTLLGEEERPVAQAALVVVAAAYASGPLLDHRLALQPVRGQVSWALGSAGAIPPFPVNGNGHFIPRVPMAGGHAWLSGSSYVQGDTSLEERREEHHANFERLQALLPRTAGALVPQFESGAVRSWTGVRCASRDRRPLVGPVQPGLWVSTAMGSRGLTFAVLCAELLAARLHGEPLPMEQELADALAVERQLRA